ncbi:hypothetical protein J7K93_06100 [bacterium]|nr:hypothetical protein [bacterium]
MRKRYIVILLVLIMAVASYAGDITLAVLNFENNSIFNRAEYEPLTRGLSEIVNTTLSGITGLKLVERRRLNSIFDELKLSQSGMLSGENTVKVGQLTGAQYLVFGSFIVSTNKKIRIDARIVNVETGVTARAEEVTGKNNKILPLAEKLCKKIVKNLSETFGNIKMKNSGRMKSIDFSSFLHFSRGVEFQELGQTEKAVEEFKKAVEIEPDFSFAKDRLNYLTGNKNH